MGSIVFFKIFIISNYKKNEAQISISIFIFKRRKFVDKVSWFLNLTLNDIFSNDSEKFFGVRIHRLHILLYSV